MKIAQSSKCFGHRSPGFRAAYCMHCMHCIHTTLHPAPDPPRTPAQHATRVHRAPAGPRRRRALRAAPEASASKALQAGQERKRADRQRSTIRLTGVSAPRLSSQLRRFLVAPLGRRLSASRSRQGKRCPVPFLPVPPWHRRAAWRAEPPTKHSRNTHRNGPCSSLLLQIVGLGLEEPHLA